MRTATFVDGGVFDNTPLRLTMRLARDGLFVPEQGSARVAVGANLRKRDNRVRYFYVNPGMGEYPPLDPPSAQPLAPSVVSLAADIGTAFIDSARRRELFAVLEEGSGQGALADLVVNRIDTTSVVQTSLGLRLGWQLGVADRFRLRPCTERSARGDARNCSQFVLQHYWAVTLVERLRAQLVLEWFPWAPRAVSADARFALHLGFGLQLF